MNNEGQLSKHELGGESVCLNDHQPIKLGGLLKDSHIAIFMGSVLVLDTDGINVIGANNTLPIVGVSDEEVAAGAEQKYVSYVAHGTVKAKMLKGADGAAFTEISKLQAIGVYAL